jgi:hypothetical protein
VSEASAAFGSFNLRTPSKVSSQVITNFASLSNKGVSNDNLVSSPQTSINNNLASSLTLISASEVTPGMFGEDAGYGGSYRFPSHVDIYDGFLTLGLGPNSGIRFTVDAGAEITQVLSTPLNPTVLKFQYGGQYDFDGNVIAAEPTKPNHLTTKNYVDSMAGSMPSGSNGQTLRHDGTSWVANDAITTDGFSTNILGTLYAGSSISGQGNVMIPPGSYFTWDTIGMPLIGWERDSGMEFRYAGRYYFDHNVGIGSATPGQKLDVAGNIRATGYYSGNYAGITGAIEVRNYDNSGYCTITVKDGLITADDCPTPPIIHD